MVIVDTPSNSPCDNPPPPLSPPPSSNPCPPPPTSHSPPCHPGSPPQSNATKKGRIIKRVVIRKCKWW